MGKPTAEYKSWNLRGRVIACLATEPIKSRRTRKVAEPRRADENVDANKVRTVFRELNKMLRSLKTRQRRCAICLSDVESRCYLNQCLHSYCMRCVVEWARRKRTCPSCSQPFVSAYYDVRSVRSYRVRDFCDMRANGRRDHNAAQLAARVCLLRTMNSVNSYFEIKRDFGRILREHKLTFDDFHNSVVTVAP